MDTTNDHLESINQIRSIMERSTTFMSLSGLSGVTAGLFSLVVGTYFAAGHSASLPDLPGLLGMFGSGGPVHQ